jgi:hypothetical protein
MAVVEGFFQLLFQQMVEILFLVAAPGVAFLGYLDVSLSLVLVVVRYMALVAAVVVVAHREQQVPEEV